MIRLDYDNTAQIVDLDRPNGTNIASDELLDTAVLISLFTRRKAEPGDVLPSGGLIREGWWGDPYEKVPRHRMGSRLWLLRRSKATRSTLNLARSYAKESLAWMIEDGIASHIVIEVARLARDMLAFRVEIYKPDKVASRWVGTWNAHLEQL